MSYYKILDKTEINNALIKLPNWRVVNNKLSLHLKFKTFTEAITFINKIAKVAEKLNHHPEIINTYTNIQLYCTTHEADDSITDLDIVFAREVSSLL